MTGKLSPRPAAGKLCCRIFIFILFCQLLLLAFSAAAPASGNESERLIVSLSERIAAADDAKEKSRLHLHRARQHARQGSSREALLDYREALKNNPAGWILNEYGYYLYHCKKYELAYQTAEKVLADYPHLAGEAGALKEKARLRSQEQYENEHPPTIIMDAKVNNRRVTRHDLIRQLEVQERSYQYRPPSTPSDCGPRRSACSATART